MVRISGTGPFCSLHLDKTQGSRLPLPKWFLAFRLVAGSKRGVSAAELARALGTSETTARYVVLRLRGAMSAGLGRLRPGLG
ncbi:hypothetical protein J2S71_002041 [Olsenella profusa DSM 13989]|uniref:hypothetical protein n=1 Tax=Olsenella profusa TaxID=138595 RepID=UPI00278910AA|nr:hypothetical protein [Olsenella profusa]MDP9860345.1 hypothetical protein [Olsenella profusa DSM 13989]